MKDRILFYFVIFVLFVEIFSIIHLGIVPIISDASEYYENYKNEVPGYTSPLHVIGRFILQSALQLLFAVFAPLWAFLWPIVCLLGVAFFIAGVVFVWRVLWNHTNETIWQLILGVALILGGFFYTTKVAIPLTLEVYVPGIIGFFTSFISIFIKLFDLLL